MRSILLAATIAGVLASAGARAQMALPTPAPIDAATLFVRQCGTCHTLNAAEPQRQGPTLAGVIGRKAGSVPGFHYSAGFAQAGWTWDEDNLDTWIAGPSAMIPGTVMIYHQPNPDIRKRIIGYLKDQH